MRGNPVKTRLANGETVFGTMVFEFLSPGLPTILTNAGSDFVFYDMEHSGFTWADVKMQFALCRANGLVPLVRPPDKTYETTARLLDLGAMGLLYQMVESAEEAERLVSYTRYPPLGRRGAMFGGAHDDYSAEPVPDIIAGAHSRTMVCVLIETAAGLENVESIMAVEGVDVAHLGHGDLSLALDVPGHYDHPVMLAGIDRILAACATNQKPAACLAGSIEIGRAWSEQGFRMISYSYDIGLMTEALRSGIDAIRSSVNGDRT